MKMTMATINNDDYLELIAEHPALKIAFLLSCSASHSSNPLTAIIVIVVVIMMVVTFSMMMNHHQMVTMMVTLAMMAMMIPARLVR